MKEKTKKIIKPIEKIFTIIKVICVIFLIGLIAVLALQRFSNNEKAIAGFRVFSVATGSMIPKYQVGDVLLVKETEINDLKVGDDVTYIGAVDTFAGRIVTHQIIKIDETESGKIFHTKGIANEVEDPTITGDQILGRVIYKCIFISLLTKLMNNMAAFYIVFIIPFAILIFLQFKDSANERRQNLKDEESDDEYEEDEDDEDDDDEYEDDAEDEDEYDDDEDEEDDEEE